MACCWLVLSSSPKIYLNIMILLLAALVVGSCLAFQQISYRTCPEFIVFKSKFLFDHIFHSSNEQKLPLTNSLYHLVEARKKFINVAWMDRATMQ
jgi:hypothetical protein